MKKRTIKIWKPKEDNIPRNSEGYSISFIEDLWTILIIPYPEFDSVFMLTKNWIEKGILPKETR